MRNKIFIFVLLIALLTSGTAQALKSKSRSLQMAFTLQQLHDEIVNDPEALGYKNPDQTWKGDQVIADLLNTKSYKVDRSAVLMETIRAVVTYDAYNNLAIDEQEWLRWMTPNSGEFQVTADMKLQLSGRTLALNGVAGTGSDGNSFWAAADDQDMAPAMLALIEIDGSRAEVLWGEGTIITASNVAYAANQ